MVIAKPRSMGRPLVAVGTLVVGDAVIGNPPGQYGLLPDRMIDEPPRLRDSVRSLLDLDFDTPLVGDCVSILEGAKDRLRALVDSVPG